MTEIYYAAPVPGLQIAAMTLEGREYFPFFQEPRPVQSRSPDRPHERGASGKDSRESIIYTCQSESD